MGPDFVAVANLSRGVLLASEARVADNPWTRARGLLGQPALASGQGLLIIPCQGIHTLGMSFSIDVVHLDRQGIVQAVLRNLAPWRIGPVLWRSRMTLELPAGAASTTQVGDELRITLVDSPQKAHAAR